MVFVGVFLGGFLIVQILFTLNHLYESIQRLPAERALREMELFRARSDAARDTIRGSKLNVPQVDSSQRISESQLKLTREYIESSNQEIAGINFPFYLQEYVDYDSSSKQALRDLQDWLYDNKYPVPLFQDRFKLGDSTAAGHPRPKICISITTANRPHAPFTYLIQTVSALLNRMNYAQYKDQVYVHVFNVDHNPQEHKEAQIVSQFVPVTNLKEGSDEVEGFPLPRKYQENLDNAEVFKRMNSLQCEYPIFIEDDALAKNNWVDSVMLAIQQMEDYDRAHKTAAPWLMLKLYCAREEDLPEVPPEGVNTTYFQRWNTVAMMINREYVLNISDHLANRVHSAVAIHNYSKPIAKDEDIDNWRSDKGLIGMCFEPVIFQHTGVFSSVENRHPDQESVELWYMKSKYFEAERKPIIFDKSQWDVLVK